MLLVVMAVAVVVGVVVNSAVVVVVGVVYRCFLLLKGLFS